MNARALLTTLVLGLLTGLEATAQPAKEYAVDLLRGLTVKERTIRAARRRIVKLIEADLSLRGVVLPTGVLFVGGEGAGYRVTTDARELSLPAGQGAFGKVTIAVAFTDQSGRRCELDGEAIVALGGPVDPSTYVTLTREPYLTDRGCVTQR